MYSKEILGVMEGKGIKPGDRISIVVGTEKAEGILMPRPDSGPDDIIVIKRDDGYNIGVRYRKGAKMDRIAAGSGEFSFPKAKLKGAAGLPKVKLVYTGGTIGSKVDYRTGGVYMLTKPEELLYTVPEISGIAEIDTKSLFSIASEDMGSDDWVDIANEVAKALNGGSRGVIVTIGTDTMHYASAALSFMLDNPTGPVVLTGAQRSSDRGSSDAFQNLICSAHMAAKSDIAEVGICMHDTSSDDRCAFIRGTRVRKMHTSRRNAFRAMNSKPIATVDFKGSIRYESVYRKMEKKGKTKAITGFEKKIALIKAYPNADPSIIDFYAGKGCKGIIIEGTGLGHAPTFTRDKEISWLPHIEKAVKDGMIIGMTSQCLFGRVNDKVYRTLRLLSGAGVVYCEDMIPEVAYVKLGWLLANRKESTAELLGKNLVGEIDKRSEYTEDII